MSAFNISFYVILRVTGVPQQVTSFHVPPKTTVRILAHNNTQPGNAANVNVGLYPEVGAHGDVLTPGTEKLYPVSTTGNIYITGAAGDGVLVTVKS